MYAIRSYYATACSRVSPISTKPARVENTPSGKRALCVITSYSIHYTKLYDLSYLKTLPVNTLKIDQSFVRAIEPGNDDARICTAIIGLAHDLGLEVVAEGLEWQSHVDFLQGEGCDVGQGYFISRPMAPQAIPRFLETWTAERLALREVVS